MLSVFICEDEKMQGEYLKKCITNTIMIEEYDMKFVMNTDSPYDILEYLKSHKGITGVYFLDVDLKSDMNGISLASKIRDYDDLGKIVFVTTHSELSYLTFLHKVEAMDYIIKGNADDVSNRIHECLKVINDRYTNIQLEERKFFKVKIGSQIRVIDYSEIMFFESSTVPHKIIIHMKNGQLEFYHSIKELSEMDENFYRCHKSFIVNKDNIKRIDKKNREIEMKNGEKCLVSIRAIRGLIDD